MEKYLKSCYLISVNEEMESKALEIIEDREDKEKSARELFKWVRDSYCWDMGKIRKASYLIEENPERAMSFSKSGLLISLLRSIEIPARYNYMNCKMQNKVEGTVESSVHAPVEVKIDDEWITADPTYGPHTRKYHDISKFRKKTWEHIENSEKKAELDRGFVMAYNYLLRFVHPDIRSIKKELRKVQEL